jgi:hypothetical protein
LVKNPFSNLHFLSHTAAKKQILYAWRQQLTRPSPHEGTPCASQAGHNAHDSKQNLFPALLHLNFKAKLNS